MRVLHAGCGGNTLPDWLPATEEVRLDADPAVHPHVVAPITDMGAIGPFDALYCSHVLEHVWPHEVPIALAEFRRVLKPGKPAFIVVPNLEGVPCDDTVMYETPSAGPITGRDMYYGHAGLVEHNPFMAHRTGFTKRTLEAALRDAGFEIVGIETDRNWNIFAAGRA